MLGCHHREKWVASSGGDSKRILSSLPELAELLTGPIDRSILKISAFVVVGLARAP